LKFHPDGHVMAVGATDGTIKIWNLTDDTLLENLQAHKVKPNTINLKIGRSRFTVFFWKWVLLQLRVPLIKHSLDLGLEEPDPAHSDFRLSNARSQTGVSQFRPIRTVPRSRIGKKYCLVQCQKLWVDCQVLNSSGINHWFKVNLFYQGSEITPNSLLVSDQIEI